MPRTATAIASTRAARTPPTARRATWGSGSCARATSFGRDRHRQRAVAGHLADRGGQSFGRELLGQEHEHPALQVTGAIVGVGRVRKVSLLERVAREVVELVLVGFGFGDSHRLASAQALVALAGDRPELGVVVVAGELDEVLLAVDVDLGDDGL